MSILLSILLVLFFITIWILLVVKEKLNEIMTLLRTIIPKDCTTCVENERRVECKKYSESLEGSMFCEGCYSGPSWLAKEFKNWIAKEASGIKKPCFSKKERNRNGRNNSSSV